MMKSGTTKPNSKCVLDGDEGRYSIGISTINDNIEVSRMEFRSLIPPLECPYDFATDFDRWFDWKWNFYIGKSVSWFNPPMDGYAATITFNEYREFMLSQIYQSLDIPKDLLDNTRTQTIAKRPPLNRRQQ